MLRLAMLELDESHAGEGYVIVRHNSLPNRRMRLKVNGLYYDLYRTALQTVIPLTSGSGQYRFTLYQQYSGNIKRYTNKGSVKIDVKLNREDAAFLHANQYVDYDSQSLWVIKAKELCQGLDKDKAYKAICEYIKHNFVYDFAKAISIKPTTLPDLDGCWNKRMGICQDLAALSASMMRACEIPAKFIIGYADKNYHAWVEATVNDESLRFDPTVEVTGTKIKRYLVERVY